MGRTRTEGIPPLELFMSRLGLSGFRQMNGISYETNDAHFDGWLSQGPFERGPDELRRSLSRVKPSNSG